MLPADAAGQLCEPAACDCLRFLAGEAILATLHVLSTARHESDDYERYISCLAWQTSPAELRATGHPCLLCFASGHEARFEVHHRTYRNWRCERAEYPTTLCHSCHLHVTCTERARKYACSPVLATNYVPVTRPLPPFDYRMMPTRGVVVSAESK